MKGLKIKFLKALLHSLVSIPACMIEGASNSSKHIADLSQTMMLIAKPSQHSVGCETARVKPWPLGPGTRQEWVGLGFLATRTL
jgi:hypothetical protein